MNPITSPVAAKTVGWLLLALLVSLGGNVFFIWHDGKQRGEAKGETERVALQSQNVSLAQNVAITQALSKQARADNSGLLKDLSEIADRGQQFHVEYGTAAAKAPLKIECAPGKGRVDAVNKLLGPKDGKQ